MYKKNIPNGPDNARSIVWAVSTTSHVVVVLSFVVGDATTKCGDTMVLDDDNVVVVLSFVAVAVVVVVTVPRKLSKVKI
jgi:hypothetical protein